MLLIPIQIAGIFLIACAVYFTWRYARRVQRQGTSRLVLVFLTTLLCMAFVIAVFTVFLTSLAFTVIRIWPPSPASDSTARANLLITAAPAIGFVVGCIVSWFAGSRIARAFERQSIKTRALDRSA